MSIYLWKFLGTYNYLSITMVVTSILYLSISDISRYIPWYICVSTFVYIYICVCVYLHLCISTFVFVYIYICVYLHLNIYICVATSIYLHLCISTFVYLHLCIITSLHLYLISSREIPCRPRVTCLESGVG